MNFLYTLHDDFNKPLSLYLNELTQNAVIHYIVYFFADAPIFILPIFLAGLWIYYTYTKNNLFKNNLLYIFYGTIVAICISIFIQQFVNIERPEESLTQAENLILQHIPDASFPSDHASVGGAFLAGLFLFGYIRFGYFFLPLYILMIFSRVAGGVHWPLDVIVGMFLGIISSIFIYKISKINIFQKINHTIIQLFSYIKL